MEQVIIDVASGEEQRVPFSDDEVAQREADEASAEARAAERKAADDNRTMLQQRAAQALATNRDFLALTSPTNAQTLAQVKLLTRECTALIRLVLNELDSTD